MIFYNKKQTKFIDLLILNFLSLLFFLLITSSLLYAHENSIDSSSEIEANKIIEEYILKNPEIIIESLEKFRENQIAIRTKNKEQNLELLYNQISTNRNFSIGSINSKIKLIEFIDYNCGYCKRTLEAVLKLSQEDPDLEVIFKDLPVLSSSSTLAAKAAIAAAIQGKYIEIHTALLNYRGNIDEAFIYKTAKTLNLNMDTFKIDMNSENTMSEISNNLKIAKALGINGTPTFIIGNDIIPGAHDYEALKEMIAKQKDAM